MNPERTPADMGSTGTVLVAEEEGDEAVEIPLEEDGTLLLSTLQAQFYGACGLKYRNPESKAIRGVRLSENKLHPFSPESGWGSHVYICVFPKENKRKSDDKLENSTPKTKRIESRNRTTTDLIVLGLPWKTTEEGLREYFESFGDLLVVQIKKDSKTGQSKGYGFIRFAKFECQMKALSKRHLIDSRWCDVKVPSSKDQMQHQMPSKIFLGRVTEDITSDDIHEYFSKYGEVTDVFIPKPFRAFAFVTFIDPHVAQSLCGEDHLIKGTSVYVSTASPRPEHGRHQGKGQMGGGTYASYDERGRGGTSSGNGSGGGGGSGSGGSGGGGSGGGSGGGISVGPGGSGGGGNDYCGGSGPSVGPHAGNPNNSYHHTGGGVVGGGGGVGGGPGGPVGGGYNNLQAGVGGSGGGGVGGGGVVGGGGGVGNQQPIWNYNEYTTQNRQNSSNIDSMPNLQALGLNSTGANGQGGGVVGGGLPGGHHVGMGNHLSGGGVGPGNGGAGVIGAHGGPGAAGGMSLSQMPINPAIIAAALSQWSLIGNQMHQNTVQGPAGGPVGIPGQAGVGGPGPGSGVAAGGPGQGVPGQEYLSWNGNGAPGAGGPAGRVEPNRQ